jgi:hypothetical protein
MSSLALYVATDNYVYFMQTVQQQLPSYSQARKLLFHLVDAHFYKGAGALLDEATSLLNFCQQQLQMGAQINYYYASCYTEMALVHLLATRGTEFIVTFE